MGLEWNRLERRRRTCECGRRVGLDADRGMRADQRALVALDADPGVPHRDRDHLARSVSDRGDGLVGVECSHLTHRLHLHRTSVTTGRRPHNPPGPVPSPSERWHSPWQTRGRRTRPPSAGLYGGEPCDRYARAGARHVVEADEVAATPAGRCGPGSRGSASGRSPGS